MSLVQLLAAQYVLDPQVISSSFGTCPPQYARDLARQNLSQSVLNIIRANFGGSSHPCGAGQWTQVAYLNMNDSSQQCPAPWRLITGNGVRACGRPSGGCHSHNYTVQRRYNKVCGQVIGYQVGSTDAFDELHPDSINQRYVDGVSVTYGTPRKHIWTFAASITETTNYPQYSCPCTVAGTGLQAPQPPSFVGNNYFCESANPLRSFENTGILKYTDDPLWDGEMCEGQCCSNATSPPWFSIELPAETSDNIEIRICGDQLPDTNEDNPIGLLDIYIQ